MEKKEVKGLLLVGHEKVPHSFGLRTGDAGTTQLMTLGSSGGLSAKHRLLGVTRSLAKLRTSIFFFFLRNGTPDWPD